MSLLISHWYPGSGVVLERSIFDLCIFTYFNGVVLGCSFKFSNHLAVEERADWFILIVLKLFVLCFSYSQ